MNRVLVIDTGLLVLLVVGTVSRTLIGKHKKLRAYFELDYDVLIQLISEYSQIVVTPNTLTETSNLVSQIGEPDRGRIREALRSIVNRAEEHYVTSRAAVTRKEYPWLGLSDAALLELPGDDTTLITVDAGLYQEALKNGRKSINFNHLRDLYCT